MCSSWRQHLLRISLHDSSPRWTPPFRVRPGLPRSGRPNSSSPVKPRRRRRTITGSANSMTTPITFLKSSPHGPPRALFWCGVGRNRAYQCRSSFSEHDPPQGVAGLAVTVGIETNAAIGLAGPRRGWAQHRAHAPRRHRCGGVQRPVAGGDEQQRRVTGTDTGEEANKPRATATSGPRNSTGRRSVRQGTPLDVSAGVAPSEWRSRPRQSGCQVARSVSIDRQLGKTGGADASDPFADAEGSFSPAGAGVWELVNISPELNPGSIPNQ